MASTSTNAWPSIPDNELTAEAIHEHLEPIQDDLWVAAACVDRISNIVGVQRTLLEVGLARTNHAVERCKAELDSTSPTWQNHREHLSRYFRAVESDAQLCYVRTILLER